MPVYLQIPDFASRARSLKARIWGAGRHEGLERAAEAIGPTASGQPAQRKQGTAIPLVLTCALIAFGCGLAVPADLFAEVPSASKQVYVDRAQVLGSQTRVAALASSISLSASYFEEQRPAPGVDSLYEASCGGYSRGRAPAQVLMLSCAPLPAAKMQMLTQQMAVLGAEIVNEQYTDVACPHYFPSLIRVSSLQCTGFTHVLYIIQDPRQVNLHAGELGLSSLYYMTAPPQFRPHRSVTASDHFVSQWTTINSTSTVGRDVTGCPDHLRAWLVTDMPVNMLFLDAAQFEKPETATLLRKFLGTVEETAAVDPSHDAVVLTNPTHDPAVVTPDSPYKQLALATFDRVMDTAYIQMKVFHAHLRLADVAAT